MRPRKKLSRGGNVDRNEKVNELIARAEKAGLRLQFDSGLVLVKRTESGDPDGQRAIIAELWRYLGEVRHLVEAHAIGERAKGLAGRPIWCEFRSEIGRPGRATRHHRRTLEVPRRGSASRGSTCDW